METILRILYSMYPYQQTSHYSNLYFTFQIIPPLIFFYLFTGH